MAAWVIVILFGILGGRQFTTHGAGTFLLDTVLMPYHLVDKLIFKSRGKAYSDIKKLSAMDPHFQELQQLLKGSQDTLDLTKVNLKEEFAKKNLCLPWQDVDKNCSCDQVCPLSFSLLSVNAHQIIPTEENSFAKRNHEYKYWDGDNLGHCWGHSTLNQKFNRLAIYNPEVKVPFEEGSEEWVDYYRKIIKDIAHDKAKIVPGFKNLKDFSAHPQLEKIFSNRIAEAWANNAMTPEGLMQTSFGPGTGKKANLKYIEKLREKLENYQKPVVVMGRKIPLLGSTRAHVNMVWRVYTEANGNIIVCYDDNNTHPAKNAKCEKRDTYSADGTMLEQWWGPKTIAYHDKTDTEKQIRSMWHLCRQTKCSQNVEEESPACPVEGAPEIGMAY